MSTLTWAASRRTSSVEIGPEQPLADINTTPLIDVLLVLLVMLVITIPAATHSLAVDLPTCGADCEAVSVDPVRNRLSIDNDDTLLWNGAPIAEGALSSTLAATRRLPVEPELQFAPAAGASYDAAAHALSIVKASGVTKFGFVGNEAFRDFPRPAARSD
ncbi:ExbD/TolR family protein [Tsuneonella amylolytica]|uniref:ExbD/TolR family protein n=1 Tax=Tsuneonella amylolytica TaxID=2338327 RepID=UPI000EA89911|nr:biopolymer transporter ExbD [Tsuneonella amylolytica]